MDTPGRKIVLILFLSFLSSLSLHAQRPIKVVTTPNFVQFLAEGDERPFLTFPQKRPCIVLENYREDYALKEGVLEVKEKPGRKSWELFFSDAVLDTTNHAPTDYGLAYKWELEEGVVKLVMWEEYQPEGKFSFAIQGYFEDFNRISVTLKSDPSEHFFGLGGHGRGGDLKGEQIFVNLDRNTPMASPRVMTNFGRAYAIENVALQSWDFTDSDWLTMRVRGDDFHGQIFYAKTPLELMTKVHRAQDWKFPDWAYGTWMGLQGGSEIILSRLATAKSHGNPVSVVYLHDWMGCSYRENRPDLEYSLRPDQTSYPGFERFIAELKAADVQVLGFASPYLSPGQPQTNYALQQGFVLLNEKGQPCLVETPYGEAYLVDLFNRDAEEWLVNTLDKMLIQSGMSGLLCDLSGGVPWMDQDLMAGGAKSIEYASAWSYLPEKIQAKHPEEDLLFLANHGWEGRFSQLFQHQGYLPEWSDGRGMRALIPAMLNAGISGFAVNFSGIGGNPDLYDKLPKSLPDSDLYFRWAEMAAFTPIYMSFEGLDQNFTIPLHRDPNLADFFAKFGRIHQVLQPYLKELHGLAGSHHYPMLRHLWLHFPEDPNVFRLDDQFLLGPDLMVAPVLEPGVDKRSVYFPKGQWDHLFTGESFTGPQLQDVYAPVGQPAVFVRRGGKWSERLIDALAGVK